MPLKTNWCPDFAISDKLPKAPFEFIYHFADHAEKTWKVLDFAAKNHCLPEEPQDPSAPTQEMPPPPVRAAPLHLKNLPGTWKKADHWFSDSELEKYLKAGAADVLDFLKALPLVDTFSKEHLRRIAMLILNSSGRWFFWGQEEKQKKAIKKELPTDMQPKAALYAFLSSLVLQRLGLGRAAMTTRQAGGGRANYFFLKKPFEDGMKPALELFGFSEDQDKTFAAYTQKVSSCREKPPRAPALSSVDFLGLTWNACDLQTASTIPWFLPLLLPQVLLLLLLLHQRQPVAVMMSVPSIQEDTRMNLPP